MITEIGGIELNDAYWDCACEDNYITPKNIPKCEMCGAVQEDSPDSIASEVERLFSV